MSGYPPPLHPRETQGPVAEIDPAALRAGATVGGFVVESEIARGGMGVVYRARDNTLGRAVALKVISPSFARDPAYRDRFRRESRLMATIEHPNVVPVYSAGQDRGRLYVVMRLIEGTDLKSLLAAHGPLAPGLVVRLVVETANALDAAHAHGLLHRDVKPANVLITGSRGAEHALLTDFGIATQTGVEALTASGQVLGTLDYIAPEILRGQSVDARADVYSLGCVLFEALTGSVPHPRDSPAARISAHLHDTPPPVADRLGIGLEEVIRRALAKDPDHRFPTAGDMARTLSGALQSRGSGPAVARPRGPEGRAASDAARRASAKQQPRRTNLSVEPSALIGRDAELVAVRELTQRGRLLTLIGPGGVGKTRIALRVATEELSVYADGAWLVELAALEIAELVPAQVAATLGLGEEPGRPWVDQLTRHLADRELLVLLDNCEHLLAACSELAARLLRLCPGVAILATSREPLGVVGERVYRVPLLRVPPPEAGLEEIARADAVRLFCARIGEQGSDFILSDDNAQAVAAVCRRVDGLPLAIELAAARTRSLSVADIAARLDQQLRLLTGGARSAPTRQQTLRAAVGWSFDLLDRLERDVLCRLSVFSGEFGVAAAEAVGSGEGARDAEILDLVGSLVDKSLLQVAVGSTGDTRYRLLEPIRHYASERLAASGDGQVGAARTAHLQHYLRCARAIAPKLTGPAHVACLDNLEADYDNMRTALEFAATNADPRPGLQLVRLLGPFWERRGHLGEGAELIARALNHARVEDAPAAERAGACLSGAYVAALFSQREQMAYANRALEAIEGLDAPAERSHALSHRAIGAALADGAIGAAGQDADSAMDIARQTGDPWLIARAAQADAHVQFAAGHLAACLSSQEEALTESRRAGDTWRVARLLTNSGEFKLAGGDRAGGRRDLEEARELTARIRAYELHTNVLHNLALLDLTDGDHRAAHAHAHEALTLAIEIGSWMPQADATLDLAVAAGAREEDLLAATLLGTADALLGNEPLQGYEQRMRDREVERLTDNLGQQTFQAAHREGTAVTAREALALTEETA